MVCIGHGLTSAIVRDVATLQLVRLVFPIFIFPTSDPAKQTFVLLSEGMFAHYSYEFYKSELLLKSLNQAIPFEFPLIQIKNEALNSCKWELEVSRPFIFEKSTPHTAITILDITKNKTKHEHVLLSEAEQRKELQAMLYDKPWEDYDFEVNNSDYSTETHECNFNNHDYQTQIIAHTNADASAANFDKDIYKYSQKDPEDWQFEQLQQQYAILREKEIRNDIPTTSLYNSKGLKNMSTDFVFGFTKEHSARDNLSECLNEFCESCPPFTVEGITESLYRSTPKIK